jgi:hypothetical protein
MGDMSRAKTHKLSDYLRDRADEFVRSVGYYTADDYELVYMREDVAAQYSEEELQAVVDDLRLEGLAAPRQENLYVLGKLNCTVRCFNRGVVMHFPHDRTSGTVAIMEYDAATRLHGFIAGCLNEIYDEYPTPEDRWRGPSPPRA